MLTKPTLTINNRQKNTMKISATTLTFTSVVGFAAGFAPNAMPKTTTSLSVSNYPEVNGWTADSSKFCAGLPGSVAPLGQFDPLGLVSEFSVEEIKRYRESEVTHGRVAMLATLGYLVGESFHPFFGGVVSGPANSHLAQVQEVAPGFFVALTVAIGMSELYRAKTGWNAPPKELSKIVDDPNSAFGARLNDDYYPGDIGFDPFGLKPKTASGFAEMQTKELNNGRLAMIGAIGMLVQEQVSQETIIETLKAMM